MGDVYLIRLDDKGSPRIDGSYIKLPPPFQPYTLRFELEGTSTLCSGTSNVFKTNAPLSKQDKFVRSQYRSIDLNPDWNRSIQVDVPIHRAGAFSWFIEQQHEGESEPTRTQEYFFDVEPALQVHGKKLPLSGLCLSSVVSKWMGPVQQWEPRLRYLSGTKKYNMLHFTPLQQRGQSNSSYSLYDQNLLADDLFEGSESLDAQQRLDLLAKHVRQMEDEHGLLGLTDVVWNHTANNSLWLQDHPEAGYNLENSPHLCAAYALDTALLEFGNKLQEYSIPNDLTSTADLDKVMAGIKEHVLSAIKLWEFYVIDTKSIEGLKYGQSQIDLGDVSASSSLKQKADKALELGCVPDHEYLNDRFAKKVDLQLFSAFVSALSSEADFQNEAKRLLDEINLRFYQEHDADQKTLLEQLYNRIKYVRIDAHGPKSGPISSSSPLIETYFVRLPENERTAKQSKGSLALACNGWMWAADPLNDFAARTSKAYLKREVIVWSDCVKLRYGKQPSDNPWLWQHMEKYTVDMARVFQGVRIDNCHSTPIPVASYLLDKAREVRPDLYIVAELFTGSETMDVIFMQKLGLSALIREAMQCNSTGELSRLVHIHGGRPVGSINATDVPQLDERGEKVVLVQSSPLGALFMDCTHDNETPNQKRCAEDTLPNAALVAFSGSSVGSVMGYDEVYPHILDIVAEDRHYSAEPNGICDVRGQLNTIHTDLGSNGYSEMHVHHEGEYITVHRVNPKTLEGVFLIAHTAFSKHDGRGSFNDVVLGGTKAEHLLTKLLVVESIQDRSTKEELLGLKSSVKDIDPPRIESTGEGCKIVVPEYFPPGAISIIKTSVPSMFGASKEDDLDEYVRSGADEAVSNCNLIDLNVLLYRCAAEEQDTVGDGAYEIPKYGSLVYCGLQGWMAPVKEVISKNDLGHALANHLRDGTWPLDYLLARQKKYTDLGGFDGLAPVTKWLESRFGAFKEKVPSFLRPRYFCIALHTLYTAARRRAISLLSDTVRKGTRFSQSLALVSLQMQGIVKSASLDPSQSKASLAAGLPHFAVSWARCWGRDIFISLRGLLLATGRHDEAREHILAFATTIKHGMIPNLLDSIRTPRYNSRDSVWFYMQAIQDYVTMVPDGQSILSERVKRRFTPYDDTYFEWDAPEAYKHESTVLEVMQEIMQRHATGLHFREANAGPNLDMQMSDKGFDIHVEVDWTTGIIHGGSQYNCGTWMDKMGESERAGSKGKPGTPRDGAAVEITGLLYSAIRFLITLNEKNLFPHTGVKTADNKEVSYKQWASLLKDNFERCYYVPESPEQDNKYDVDPKVINRRGIYKDLYKSGKPFEDYQLRANVPMAMTVAPDLFDPAHAVSHLNVADAHIRGPLGIATLDPSDWDYRPYYNNSEDSTDEHTSKGRNYHQGPEWVFPMGYFLRAYLHFQIAAQAMSPEQAVRQVHQRLAEHKLEIDRTPWAGLAELTNKDGQLCNDSSPTQAWSASTLLDVLDDIRALSLKHKTA
ncbi:bifunctional 4-alpha-glucanotransferase/amylo-alpha-1,6-glucosidase [Savitreella phatthalungensis]